MSKFKDYLKDQKKQRQPKKQPVNIKKAIINFVMYGLPIIVLAEITNWIFGLEYVHKLFMKGLRNFQLDIAIDIIEPHFDILNFIENIAFLKDWIWLIPFALSAMLIGSLYTYINEQGISFKTALNFSLVVMALKFLLISLPYGVLPAFIYIVDFMSSNHLTLTSILITCVISLLIGSEIMIFWIKNYGVEHMKSKYM